MKGFLKLVGVGFLLNLSIGCVSFEDAALKIDPPVKQLDSTEVSKSSRPVTSKNGGIFYSNKRDLRHFIVSHNNIILGNNKNSMVLDLNNVGSDWEQVSIKFSPLDFTVAPYIYVKARVDERSPDSLRLRIDLIDNEGKMTNYVPQERYIRKKPYSKTYKFEFAGNWVQNWPFRADVNPQKISEIRMNFNGGGPNYLGRLYIEEIFASDGKIKNLNPENYIIEGFDEGVSGWWSANNMTLTSEEDGDLNVAKLVLDDVGQSWESFGKRFSEPINLTNTPILRIKLKADAPGKLRFQLADYKEYSTNANPPVVEFPKTSEYTNLYFDFRGRFYQSHPTQRTVDSSQIKMLALFVNAPPEPQNFSGTLIIDEIGVLSVSEYEKLKNVK